MSNLNVKVLSDFWVVGSLHSGHDLVQNMYGMYLGMSEMRVGSNMNTAIHAGEIGWNNLHGTSLGYCPFEDIHSLASLTSAFNNKTATAHNLIRITRDYKDCLTQAWRQYAPEISFEEFVESSLGYSLITEFEKDAEVLDFHATISYEELVASPQQVMGALIHHLIPTWDGEQKAKEFRPEILDTVVQNSGVRDLRAGPSGSNLEKVGVHAEWLTVEQAEAVDAFVASL